MEDVRSLTRENFHLLLNWLDADEDVAAEKYEEIRKRLIQLFSGRGCHEAELLADRTIDRVTTKVGQIAETYKGDPAPYFYGVAKNIHHEWIRQQKPTSEINEAKLRVVEVYDDTEDVEYSCLEKCLKTLPDKHRSLITDYYGDEKRKKIERRKALAKRLGITTGALQIRAYRLRSVLFACVTKCAAAA